LNEKIKEELEKIENIYGDILENIYGTAEETLGNQEKKKEQQIMVDR